MIDNKPITKCFYVVCLKCDQELEIAECIEGTIYNIGGKRRFTQWMSTHIESCRILERSSPFSVVVR